MDNIPGEGTRAGDIFAVMVILAPVVSVIISAFIRSRLAAFFLALLGAGIVIGGAFFLAGGGGEEVAGLASGGLIFGGWAGLLSLFLSTVITVGRGIVKMPEVTPVSETID